MPIHDYTPEQVAASLKEALRLQHIRQIDLARELKITPPTLSEHLNGKKYISPQLAAVLADKYDFNLEFLVAGKGKLHNGEYEHVLDEEQEICELLLDHGWEAGCICISDIADALAIDPPVFKVRCPSGHISKQTIYDITFHPYAKIGQKIVFHFFDKDTEEEFDVNFRELSGRDATYFIDYLFDLIMEDQKMGRMGEIAYHSRMRTKRKDDDSLISFRRNSEDFVIMEIADELYENEGLLRFINKLCTQETIMGTYPEYRSKMQFLFACMSAIFSYEVYTEVDYNGLVKTVKEIMDNYKEKFCGGPTEECLGGILNMMLDEDEKTKKTEQNPVS